MSESNTEVEDARDEVMYCARHPRVETVLRCGRCETPICPRCLVQTPVGARCRQCANVRTLPTFDVSPTIFARGVAAALAGGAFTGAAWGFLLGDRAFFGLFVTAIVAFVVGWAVAQCVGLATNKRRGVALQVCAAAGCVVAYLVHNAVNGDALIVQGDDWGFIAAAGAAFIAYSLTGR